MATIKPYGLTQVKRLGDDYLAVMMQEIRAVLETTAKHLHRHDVIQSSHMIKILWLDNAVDRLMAELHDVVHESALDVRNQLQRLVNKQVITAAVGDDIVPPVDGVFAIPELPDLLGEIYLNTRRNYLVNVGNEVWDVVRTQLLEGMHAGEGIAELKDRVTASAGFSEARAERVARTEVVGASNAGALGQMQASGMQSTKTWLATNGDRTRPTHREANGQTVDLNEKFMVGGYPMDRPHDPNGPADEIINCRCTLTFEIADDDISATLVGNELVAPDVKVMPGGIGAPDWMLSKDTDVRASNLWAESYEGQQSIRTMIRNIDTGVDPFRDVNTNHGLFFYTYKNLKDDNWNSLYSDTNLRDDLLSAALNIRKKLTTASTSDVELFRGMRIDDPTHLFKIGETFSADLSSWSPKRNIAQQYADAPSKERVGSSAVLMKLKPGTRALNIDNGTMLGGKQGSNEHLTVGQLRVFKIDVTDQYTIIEVEPVS